MKVILIIFFVLSAAYLALLIGPIYVSKNFLVTMTLSYKDKSYTSSQVWTVEVERTFSLASAGSWIDNKFRGDAFVFKTFDGKTILALRRLQSGLSSIFYDCLPDSNNVRDYMFNFMFLDLNCSTRYLNFTLTYLPRLNADGTMVLRNASDKDIYISNLHLRTTDIPVTKHILNLLPWLRGKSPNFDLTDNARSNVHKPGHFYVRDFTTESY